MRPDARPSPPLWAIQAGLPEPRDGESFVAYVTRLGLDSTPLLEDLMPRTAELANLRLASYLAQTMRYAFLRHCDELAERYIPAERRKMLHAYAASLPAKRAI